VEVGVGERFGPLGPERCIERLYTKRDEKIRVSEYQAIWHGDDDDDDDDDDEVSRTL
jgi:hypothetical protein